MAPRDRQATSISEQDAAILAVGGTVAYEDADEYSMRVDEPSLPELVEVWPDSADALALFDAIGTQWHYSQNGPTGINYDRRDIEAKRLGLRARRRNRAFEGLRVMESEVLAVVSEQMKEAVK
jgi:hypothetical protein